MTTTHPTTRVLRVAAAVAALTGAMAAAHAGEVEVLHY